MVCAATHSRTRCARQPDWELLRVEFSGLAHDGSAHHVGALDTFTQGRRLVDYLIEARAFMADFWAAQEAGDVPPDEPCDFRSTIDWDEQGRLRFVNDLSNRARLAAFEAAKAGHLVTGVINAVHWSWASGNDEAWAWLHVADDRVLFQRTTLRSFDFGCGFGGGELAGTSPRLRSRITFGRCSEATPYSCAARYPGARRRDPRASVRAQERLGPPNRRGPQVRLRGRGLAVLPSQVVDAVDGWCRRGRCGAVMVVEVEPAVKGGGAGWF